MPKGFGFFTSVDTRAADRALKLLGTEAKAAQARAMDRSASAGKEETVRQIREELPNFKLSAARKRVKVFKTRGSGRSILVTALASPFSDFTGTRKVAKGVRVAPKGPSKLIKGAFLVKFKSGRKTVAIRKGEPRRRGAKGQDLPIKQLTTTFAVQALNARKRFAAVLNVAKSAFEKSIIHEINFRLQRKFK